MAELVPAIPGPHDIGRLSAATPLRPGWPCRGCRGCGHPLSFALNHQTGTATGVLGCCHCDNNQGVHG